MTDTHHRLQGCFTWPTESRFPGLPLIDTQIPKLFLAECGLPNDDWQVGVYLVNNSRETLKSVISTLGGTSTVESENPDGFIMKESEYGKFENVLPGEAVMLTNYHTMYDSDFLMQLRFSVEKEEIGKLEFSVVDKGSFGMVPLLWEDGSSKYLRGSESLS